MTDTNVNRLLAAVALWYATAGVAVFLLARV